jgi:hypothetical protein
LSLIYKIQMRIQQKLMAERERLGYNIGHVFSLSNYWIETNKR